MRTQAATGVRRHDGWVPVLIVIIVLGLLHDRNSARVRDMTAGELAIFSRRTSMVAGDDFRSGDVVAVFGSNRLDLRQASFANDAPTVAALAIFGKVELVVPRGSRIVGDRVPLLGSVRVPSDSGNQTGPTIRVNGVALFGSVIVHN